MSPFFFFFSRGESLWVLLEINSSSPLPFPSEPIKRRLDSWGHTLSQSHKHTQHLLCYFYTRLSIKSYFIATKGARYYLPSVSSAKFMLYLEHHTFSLESQILLKLSAIFLAAVANLLLYIRFHLELWQTHHWIKYSMNKIELSWCTRTVKQFFLRIFPLAPQDECNLVQLYFRNGRKLHSHTIF